MDVNEHAEELASDLGVDKEEVIKDLRNLLEYSVPIDEAKQSVRRKHGGGGGGSSPTPDAVDVAEIIPVTSRTVDASESDRSSSPPCAMAPTANAAIGYESR